MSTEVARLFDAMADSYDRLEPWYEHLYQALHAILRAQLTPAPRGKRRRSEFPARSPVGGRPGRALDAGCGVGFQTAMLEDAGYESHGIDISPGLLAVARRRLGKSALAAADIESLPYRDESFDVVTCCGSTLSFVETPARALREIGRVLRPGGMLLLECEHKWSLDLAWACLSSVTHDSLGYGVTPREWWRQLARPLREGFHLDYPGYGRLRLFTLAELRAMLRDQGLTPVRRWGIHSVTNLIPSTILHRQGLGQPLAALYRWLCAADGALGRLGLTLGIANCLVVLARKHGATHRPRHPVWDRGGRVPDRHR